MLAFLFWFHIYNLPHNCLTQEKSHESHSKIASLKSYIIFSQKQIVQLWLNFPKLKYNCYSFYNHTNSKHMILWTFFVNQFLYTSILNIMPLSHLFIIQILVTSGACDELSHMAQKVFLHHISCFQLTTKTCESLCTWFRNQSTCVRKVTRKFIWRRFWEVVDQQLVIESPYLL